MPAPALQFVEANGVRFGYFEEGKGPLVLLVHGFPDTAHTWDAVRPALAAAGYRAVSPFTRGYFPTGLAPDGAYDTDTLAEDLVALIGALGEKQAILVGHDFGAGSGYSAAALHPDQLRQLITVAIPHPAGVPPTLQLVWNLRHFLAFNLPGAVARARQDNFAIVDELVQRWSPAWKVPPGETDEVKAAFSHAGSLEAAIGYYRTLSPRLPRGQRLRIAVPTVCFAGEQDMVPVEAAESARTRFTGSYAVVKMPGGHFMHREHPEHFIRELLRVLLPPGTA